MSEEVRAMYQAKILKLERDLKHIRDYVSRAAVQISIDIEKLQKECGQPENDCIDHKWIDINYHASFIQEVIK